jgi:hypothetical protein
MKNPPVPQHLCTKAFRAKTGGREGKFEYGRFLDHENRPSVTYHFLSLYSEAVASQHHFSIQQMAYDSGYRSYTTFSIAFKQRMGQNVTAWMRKTTK